MVDGEPPLAAFTSTSLVPPTHTLPRSHSGYRRTHRSSGRSLFEGMTAELPPSLPNLLRSAGRLEWTSQDSWRSTGMSTNRESCRCLRELVTGLKCRLCGKLYPKEALNFCTDDFGPLEVTYDYAGRVPDADPAGDCQPAQTMWRYRELLPIDGEPTVGLHVGGTPLIQADRLARVLGVSELYLKNDAVNHPGLSFKDRVVAVALSKAVELGFQTVGCALDRATWPAASRPTPPPRGWRPTCSFPTAWSRARCSAPPSTEPRSSPSRAIMTR